MSLTSLFCEVTITMAISFLPFPWKNLKPFNLTVALLITFTRRATHQNDYFSFDKMQQLCFLRFLFSILFSCVRAIDAKDRQLYAYFPGRQRWSFDLWRHFGRCDVIREEILLPLPHRVHTSVEILFMDSRSYGRKCEHQGVTLGQKAHKSKIQYRNLARVRLC